MKYLNKLVNSDIVIENLSYETSSDRIKIKSSLLREQYCFCAYSEKYICKIDEAHIEHFDPRLKKTQEDGYMNWYATLPWMNSHKPKKIGPYLPILLPSSPDITNRITYNIATNTFEVVRLDDCEADNLIKYLGFNKFELVEERKKQINRIKLIFDTVGKDSMLLILSSHKEYVSFATALEHVFCIDLMPYITAA
ncbi:HNH endonuclease family protein [Hymenobacter metallicola]|uniref:TIGR02646 family protein n=1 Tax=Hymenobacter metallicola TaxID=2563114 RepID=A0A4Z0QLX0_9BACT|nr:hypothetical protein [Hymenobacter metallicola]TGE29732.1 hypothetical protein E5K02_09815 [Hymenobacter metallicola]